jgi:prepilin-type N-terminal cleavage/methylation domain-containing protein
MSIASGQVNRATRSGFTLLEITLAVAILAMMSLAIYRFVQTNLVAIRVSSDAAAEDERYGGLRDLLTAQWQSLAPGNGRLLGEPFKFNDRSRDEITWICGAGPGLLRGAISSSPWVCRGNLKKATDSISVSCESRKTIRALPERMKPGCR